MLRTLIQKRESIKGQMATLWKQKEDGKDWSPEERKQYDALHTQAKGVNEDIKLRSEYIEDLQASTPKADREYAKTERSVSLHSIIRSKIYDQTKDDGYKGDFGREREVLAETRGKAKNVKDGYFPVPESVFEKRTDITSAAASGGDLISEVVRPDQYVEGLYEGTWMQKAGVPILSGLQGNVKIPRIKDKPSFSWIAENTNFPEQDMTFEDVELTPNYAGAIQVFSLGIFLRSAGKSVMRFVQEELMRSFRAGLEKSFIQDDGTSNKPKGLYSIVPAANDVTATTGQATNKGGSVTYAEALSVERKITSTNQMMPLVWLINDGIRIKALQTLKFSVAGASQIFQGGMFADRPAVITNSISSTIKRGTGDTSRAILFQPKSLVLGRWTGGIQLQVNTQGAEYWKAGKTAVRVIDVCNQVSRRDSDFASYKEIDA